MRNFFTVLTMAAGLAQAASNVDTCSRPKAVVYRGPASCRGCPESVGHLLETSPYNFKVTYAGPNEKHDVNENTLRGATVYAHGGGPDLERAYKQTKPYEKAIRDFVSSGGHYLGFCLGAYLAGSSPGYNLLPKGADTDSEITRKNAQVKSPKDTVIQIDWTFVDRHEIRGRWAYFQEGVVIKNLNGHGKILGTYSQNSDVAAAVVPYGKGWVGLVGPHPEATKDWYEDENIKNPDGVKLDIGYDFIAATINGGK